MSWAQGQVPQLSLFLSGTPATLGQAPSPAGDLSLLSSDAPTSLEKQTPATWLTDSWNQEGHVQTVGKLGALAWPSRTTLQICDVLTPGDTQPLGLGLLHFVPRELIWVEPLGPDQRVPHPAPPPLCPGPCSRLSNAV